MSCFYYVIYKNSSDTTDDAQGLLNFALRDDYWHWLGILRDFVWNQGQPCAIFYYCYG